MSVKTHIEPSSFVVCVLVTLCAAFLSLSFIFTFFLFRFQSIRSSIAGINGFNGIYFLYWCSFFSAGILAIEFFQVCLFILFNFGFTFSTFLGKGFAYADLDEKNKYSVTCSADCSSITIFTSRLCFASKNARRCFVSPKK